MNHPVDPLGYSYSELRPLILAAARARISALVLGHPGLGKSALAHDVAAELGLPVVDLRLAQRDPSELAGVYVPDRTGGRLDLLAPGWVRRACQEPVLVFLDEINAAVTRLHQAAAYQIVLERRVGDFVFHPDTRILAAGNLEEDRAIVTRLSSALGNRFAWFRMRVDASDWLAWAHGAGIDPSVTAYVQRRGAEVLYQPGEGAFPSPRSWAMASALMTEGRPDDQLRLAAACIGEAAAQAYVSWLRLRAKVRPRQIVADGQIPSLLQTEPSMAYAIVHTVAEWLTDGRDVPDAWLPNVVRFVQADGLDAEHAILFLRTLSRQPRLVHRLRGMESFRALAARWVDLRMAA